MQATTIPSGSNATASAPAAVTAVVRTVTSAARTPPPESTPPRGAFRRLWASVAASNLADGVALAGLPVLAATLTTSPIAIAGVTVAVMLPMVVTALPAGVLADRADARLIMAVGNVLRAAGMLVVLAALWHPSTRLLGVYAAAVLVGSSEVLVDTAAQTVLPSLVRREDLATANARIGGTQMVLNNAVGAPIGASLAVGAAAWVLALPAALYGVAAGLARAVAVPARPPRTRTGTAAELREGFAVLREHRVLGRLAVANGLSNLGNTAFGAVLVVYVVQALGLPEQAYGWLAAVLAGGGVLASTVAARTQAWLGLRGTLHGSMALLVAVYVAMAVRPSVPVAVVGVGLMGFGAVQWGTTSRVLRQTAAPTRLLGRVTASMYLLALVATPIGGVLGGVVAEVVGVTAVGLLAAAANVLALVVMATAGAGAYPSPLATLSPRHDLLRRIPAHRQPLDQALLGHSAHRHLR